MSVLSHDTEMEMAWEAEARAAWFRDDQSDLAGVSDGDAVVYDLQAARRRVGVGRRRVRSGDDGHLIFRL